MSSSVVHGLPYNMVRYIIGAYSSSDRLSSTVLRHSYTITYYTLILVRGEWQERNGTILNSTCVLRMHFMTLLSRGTSNRVGGGNCRRSHNLFCCCRDDIYTQPSTTTCVVVYYLLVEQAIVIKYYDNKTRARVCVCSN